MLSCSAVAMATTYACFGSCIASPTLTMVAAWAICTASSPATGTATAGAAPAVAGALAAAFGAGAAGAAGGAGVALAAGAAGDVARWPDRDATSRSRCVVTPDERSAAWTEAGPVLTLPPPTALETMLRPISASSTAAAMRSRDWDARGSPLGRCRPGMTTLCMRGIRPG